MVLVVTGILLSVCDLLLYPQWKRSSHFLVVLSFKIETGQTQLSLGCCAIDNVNDKFVVKNRIIVNSL